MIGMPTIVFLMVLVLGLPIVHYGKRDSAYMAAKGQPEKVRKDIWYGN